MTFCACKSQLMPCMYEMSGTPHCLWSEQTGRELCETGTGAILCHLGLHQARNVHDHPWWRCMYVGLIVQEQCGSVANAGIMLCSLNQKINMYCVESLSFLIRYTSGEVKQCVPGNSCPSYKACDFQRLAGSGIHTRCVQIWTGNLGNYEHI